ncbi:MULTISPECIES: hypothetical protein [Bradyrhizobium]|nr:hypothetical protein [Bradyrhizobium vignae]
MRGRLGGLLISAGFRGRLKALGRQLAIAPLGPRLALGRQL